MNYLAVDTSGAHLTVILIKNDEVFCTFLPDGNLKHSITMMPEVENLLLKANLNISDIDVYSAVIGPGSFTGIRIGVSAIKAFALSHISSALRELIGISIPKNRDSSICDQ